MIKDGLIECYELTDEDRQKRDEFLEITKEDEDYKRYAKLWLEYLTRVIKKKDYTH